MKYGILLMLSLILTGCGTLTFGSDRLVYKAGKLSCLQLRCCYPYGPDERFMVCNQGTTDGDGVFIRYRFGFGK